MLNALYDEGAAKKVIKVVSIWRREGVFDEHSLSQCEKILSQYGQTAENNSNDADKTKDVASALKAGNINKLGNNLQRVWENYIF